MDLLEALFTGVRAFVNGVGGVARQAVRTVLEEVDRSPMGRAVTRVLEGAADRLFGNARSLAEEQAELAAKFRRDGQRSEADVERLVEIASQKEKLRKQLEKTKTAEAAQDLAKEQSEIIAAPITSDETSATVGLITSKKCPECGGLMRLRQSPIRDRSNGEKRRDFWWKCTSANATLCPRIDFDPWEYVGTVLRKPNPDLDGNRGDRLKIWQRDDVALKAHQRIRSTLGDEDKSVICPHHMLPMKLLPKASPGGLMLDSYEYICPGVGDDGRACNYKIQLETYVQAAEALRRRDGVGIIDAA